MKNLKYILIFLLLVIISTAGYAGWDYYNTKKIEEERVEQEEQWKIYENEEFGFKVSYPSYWKIDIANERFYFRDKRMKDQRVLAHVSVIERDILFEQLVNNYLHPLPFQGSKEYINEKEIKILNEYENTYTYIIEKDERFYVLTVNLVDSSVSEDKVEKNIFDIMYKSLEFID